MRFALRQTMVRLVPPAWIAALVVGLSALHVDAWVRPARGQSLSPLRVRLEAGAGPFYVGQGIELTFAVTARDQRPQIELPRLSHADIWIAGTSFQPIIATGIGNVISGDNLYLTRLRIVPRRAGALEVPPVVARLDGRSGKSRPLHLAIETPPLEGRPAEFLGGVGEFSVQASAAPTTTRVGQELMYKITISGAAAWGSVAHPDLGRLERILVAPRIEPLPEESDNEPPARTFVYRLRPQEAGSAVLPPLAIVAFDPRSRQYITKVTKGIPIKVVAVPAFEPKSLNYASPDLEGRRRIVLGWSLAGTIVAVLLGASGLAVIVRQRWRLERRGGEWAARRFARRFARELSVPLAEPQNEDEKVKVVLQIVEALVAYAQIGTGRPPGAITPAEAEQATLELTKSELLAEQAALLVASCDQALYSSRPAEPGATQLVRDARGLFTSLGTAPISAIQSPTEPPALEIA
jgi:hypothetical protein